MKKIFFLTGLTFMASYLFAQNNTVVNQTGNDQTAQVEQTGSDHKAQVIQAGDQNHATVDQSGKFSYVDVISRGNGNRDDVDQLGLDPLAASISLYGHIYQTGDKNEVDLHQEGNNIDINVEQRNGHNTADIDQVGFRLQYEVSGLLQIRENGEKGNKATLTQRNTLQSLDVVQKGSGNEITSTQGGSTNQYSALQDGIENFAVITQSGDNNWTGWVSFTGNRLVQSGTKNNATITQLGNSNFLVEQYGMSNKTGLELTGSWTTVLQVGNSNVVGGLLGCQPTDIAVFLPGSSMDAIQLGDNNKLNVQTAGNLVVRQNNLSTSLVGNTIKYTQTNIGDVALSQLGDKNLIWLKNTSPSDPMDVDVDQTGLENTVGIIENGIVASCARFAGAHLNVDQEGTLNSLNLDSQSSGALVDVVQKGNNNQASVIQN